MHANWFLALHYANKGRLKIALSSFRNGALVCSIYVASGNEVEHINNEEMKKFKKGRHEAERKRYEVEQKKTESACGYPSVPILLVSAVDNWK
ncbi:hypothetical protein T10_13429, partial [Trichinella papuae]